MNESSLRTTHCPVQLQKQMLLLSWAELANGSSITLVDPHRHSHSGCLPKSFLEQCLARKKLDGMGVESFIAILIECRTKSLASLNSNWRFTNVAWLPKSSC